MKKKIILLFLLLVIFCFALFFRIYFCYNKVFSEPIKYSADDGVYHMRLVENELLGNHFPHRIYFDPYTNFPKGTYIYFAPLYDQILAVIIWLVAFGNPNLELINHISPFYPAVIGSLIIFLVYFIAKTVWDRKIGLFSAFLVAISPPYLFKSLLGNNDHHVAEVFFSTLAIMFLFLALKVKEETKDKLNNKKFWLFIILSGFSFGLYFLTWIGALLFLFILFVFITVYYLIEYLKGDFPQWVLFIGVTIFSIVLIMIFPFFNHPDLFNANMYNIRHLESLLLGIGIFIFIYFSTRFIEWKKMNRYFLFLFLLIGIILVFVVLKFIFPQLFSSFMQTFKATRIGVVNNKFARELISEMVPLKFGGAFLSFSSFFYLSIISLIIILYKFIKDKKPKYLLVLIWTIIIALMTGIFPFVGQSRFGYYLSINVSILSAFIIIKGFEFGWRSLRLAQNISEQYIRPYFLVGSILILFNVIFFLIYPFPFNIGLEYPHNLPDFLKIPLITAKGGPHTKHSDWYEALIWLRDNTPDPGLDYYSLYKEPSFNTKLGRIEAYSYPEKSYGIVAPWSMGHMITYYAHRIPVSNPFQEGIGKKDKNKVLEIGEAVFFLETEEEKAVSYLEKLKVKYIITDYSLILPGFFKNEVKWAQEDLDGYIINDEEGINQEPSKFDNSMAVRLHRLDGRGITTKRDIGEKKIEFKIPPLSHFRLVYESPTTVGFSVDNNPEEIFKKVKIFEYVKGAQLQGKIKPGTKIIISSKIKTNQNRTFLYKKEIISDKYGFFRFVVPYPTYKDKDELPNLTKSVVFAEPYNLEVGERKIKINISEKDILKGKIIEIKFN